ncbi:MAG TPA: hypothetical protein VGS19_19655, partial [Streptosporangiaceae bacterium]|nr:hypothetical protein [Streptosporangiaceae bacterium]
MAGCARAWRGALRRAVVVAAAVALAAGTAGASAPPGQHGSGRVGAPPPAAHAALGVSAFHPRRVRLPQRSAATRYPRNDHWPGAASGTAVLGTPPAPLVAGRHALALEPWSLGAQSNAGRTPVWAQLVTSGLHAVRVRVLPHAAALAAGVGGVAFTAAAPPGSRGGLIRLGLDYAGFARVFGG